MRKPRSPCRWRLARRRNGCPIGDLHGGLFAGAGGPVLIASYEDWPAVTADRLRKLAATWPDLMADAATAPPWPACTSWK